MSATRFLNSEKGKRFVLLCLGALLVIGGVAWFYDYHQWTLHQEYQGKTAELNAQIKTLYSESAANTKTLEKLTARLAKKADRKRKNKKAAAVEGATPKPCIFTTPVNVSDELLAFLGKPKNTQLSRSNVTKAISTYCRDNKLMNKQAINADAPLRKLLTLKEDDKLTILNLQKYLGRHYIKAAPVAA